MTCFEIVIAIVNIIAVIVAPIVAVKVGQHLQNRAQSRKDKMDIFKTLMANRTGWSTASVYAMNIIDVVFVDDEAVRACWKTYYEKLCIQEPDEMQKGQIRTAHYKMLEAMAISLGYKDKITWETIQNPYMPVGMMSAMEQQQVIQGGQELLASSMSSILSRMTGENAPQSQVKVQEDEPHAQ